MPKHYTFAIVHDGKTITYQRATTATNALFFARIREEIPATAKAWRV